jgi:UDP-2-acetamido-3-amino-2,3-dideoxy-glucuronate N-acetyltransferase
VAFHAIKSSVFIHPAALVESSEIGRNTRIWAFAHVMNGAHIGSDCNICDHVFVETGAVLGSKVTVKNGVAIWDRVTIEDSVFLGPNCAFTNDRNPRAHIKKQRGQLEKTLIRKNATIGANATIVCGITVGRFAFIGAGATVIRSVPDFALMVGNPARQIGWMCVCAHKLPLSAEAPRNSVCACPVCKNKFIRAQAGLVLNARRGR